jgi:hypothetical protein
MHDNGLSYIAHEKRFSWGTNSNTSSISENFGPWMTASIALSSEVSIQPFTSIKAKVFCITDSGYQIRMMKMLFVIFKLLILPVLQHHLP